MRPKFSFAAALVILTFLLAAASSCTRSGPPEAAASPATPARSLPQPALALAAARGGAASIADVTERVMPAVVNISTTRVVHGRQGPGLSPFESDPFFRQFFGDRMPGGHGRGRDGDEGEGMPRDRREQSLGSGVIVSPQGIVLTNNHVVDHADDIRVTLSDQRELHAKVLGSDPKSDVAVLKLEGKVGELTALPWGDSNRLRLGDVVLAVGDPFGVGETVTMGIVSAKGRANMGILDYEDFIQTDAAINPGNSGGPLVDMEGKLVGITTAILSQSGGYQGVGFAIPSSMARPIMESLIRTGKVQRGFLGVAIQDLTPDLARSLGVDAPRGALVSDVTADSPASRAGLARGDVVVGFNGQQVDSAGRFRNLVASAAVGGTVKIDVLRNGRKVALSAVLGEAPRTAAAGGDRSSEGEGPLAGVAVADLDASARQRFDVGRDVRQGVVVTEVAPDSRAAEAGLRPGDVILEVNRERVASAGRFGELSRGSAERALLLVQRGGVTTYMVLHK
ncbi:MAG TPA: DegQ family serine endoprotease [Kofleriaceae bacterium]|nr:DegQ family serine endoprotease [Kofleriaceae bacterium]